MMACRMGRADIVSLCLQFGARNDPHPDFGQTALHAAVGAGQITCVRVLVGAAEESGADVIITNLTDPRGQTPLHVAAGTGTAKIVQVLLHHGAQIEAEDSNQATALHFSCAAGSVDCISIILDLGADALIY
jgi:ankyrin repeat protein